MRLTRFSPVSIRQIHDNRTDFTGAHGEAATITVLDHDMIRVQYLPDGEPRLARTWAVVGEDGDVPREGRPRDDLSPFKCPPFEHRVDGDTLHIRTEQMRVSARLSDLRLEWCTSEGEVFAADGPPAPMPMTARGGAFSIIYSAAMTSIITALASVPAHWTSAVIT